MATIRDLVEIRDKQINLMNDITKIETFYNNWMIYEPYTKTIKEVHKLISDYKSGIIKTKPIKKLQNLQMKFKSEIEEMFDEGVEKLEFEQRKIRREASIYLDHFSSRDELRDELRDVSSSTLSIMDGYSILITSDDKYLGFLPIEFIKEFVKLELENRYYSNAELVGYDIYTRRVSLRRFINRNIRCEYCFADPTILDFSQMEFFCKECYIRRRIKDETIKEKQYEGKSEKIELLSESELSAYGSTNREEECYLCLQDFEGSSNCITNSCCKISAHENCYTGIKEKDKCSHCRRYIKEYN